MADSLPTKNDPSQPGMVLLTGAAQGIGRATARVLGERGYRLGLIDRSKVALDELADELRGRGTKVDTRVADVRDARALNDAVAAFGPIDVAVTCAGVGKVTSVLDLDLEALRQMLEVNVLGVATTIAAVLPGMFERKTGHIVGISSIAGFRGMPWMPGYSASKAAVTTYLEALRPALKLRGVRVTTVFPGFVRTGMTIETPFRRPVPMLEPEQAALYLVRAIEKKPRDYVFPLSARLGMGLLRRLPTWGFDYCMDKAGPRALTTEF